MTFSKRYLFKGVKISFKKGWEKYYVISDKMRTSQKIRKLYSLMEEVKKHQQVVNQKSGKYLSVDEYVSIISNRQEQFQSRIEKNEEDLRSKKKTIRKLKKEIKADLESRIEEESLFDAKEYPLVKNVVPKNYEQISIILQRKELKHEKPKIVSWGSRIIIEKNNLETFIEGEPEKHVEIITSPSTIKYENGLLKLESDRLVFDDLETKTEKKLFDKKSDNNVLLKQNNCLYVLRDKEFLVLDNDFNELWRYESDNKLQMDTYEDKILLTDGDKGILLNSKGEQLSTIEQKNHSNDKMFLGNNYIGYVRNHPIIRPQNLHIITCTPNGQIGSRPKSHKPANQLVLTDLEGNELLVQDLPSGYEINLVDKDIYLASNNFLMVLNNKGEEVSKKYQYSMDLIKEEKGIFNYFITCYESGKSAIDNLKKRLV